MGQANDPLTRAIAEDERIRGHPADGHISRMASQLGYMSGRGKKYYLITSLCNNMSDMLSDVWPRIDKAPHCRPRWRLRYARCSRIESREAPHR